MAASLSELFDRLVPDEMDALLTRMLGSSFTLAASGGSKRFLGVGTFHGYLTERLLDLAGHPKAQAALVVVDDDSERALFLSGGAVVGATSSVLFERLGRILYKESVLTHEDADTLVRLEENDGPQALVGWIPDDTLRWAVGRRVREVVAALPYVSRGHYVVVKGEPHLGGLPSTAFDPGDLGAEARLLYDAWRQGTTQGASEAGHTAEVPAPIPGPLRPPMTREEEVQDILRRVRDADIRLEGS